MKNVLLTTTALVAFAGTAFAAAHEGGSNITFGGDAEVKYNTDVNGNAGDGLGYEVNLDLGASVELNNGITAGATYTFNLGDGSNDVGGDYYPVIYLESAYGKLSAGNADAIGGAADHFTETDGVSGFDDGYYTEDYYFAIRADMSFSGIDVSISTADVLEYWGPGTDNDLQVGVSGSFGNFDFGLGYGAEVWGETQMGLNVGTTFGAFDVDFSVFDGEFSGTDYGIQVAYAINPSITVGAYFASVDDAADTEYGASVDYASGALTVGLSYEDGTIKAQEITLDVSYQVMPELTVFAGYKSLDGALAGEDGAYVAAQYDLGSGATAWVSYSEYDESADPEFDDGLAVGVSVVF